MKPELDQGWQAHDLANPGELKLANLSFVEIGKLTA